MVEVSLAWLLWQFASPPFSIARESRKYAYARHKLIQRSSVGATRANAPDSRTAETCTNLNLGGIPALPRWRTNSLSRSRRPKWKMPFLLPQSYTQIFLSGLTGCP